MGVRVTELNDRRVLVVGASRGIGSAIARACGAAGAKVAVAARSADLLHELADEVDGIALQCDVADDAACRSTVERAVTELGGLDAVVYATGVTAFASMGDVTRSTMEEIFTINLFGAQSILAAALPHLEASAGHAIVLNSESAKSEPGPWHGIGAYIASKRALDSVVRSFQLEHPKVAFTSYFVGSTLSGIPAAGAMEFMAEWMQRGHTELSNALLPEDHGRIVVDILSAGDRILIDAVGVRPRHIPGGVIEIPPDLL